MLKGELHTTNQLQNAPLSKTLYTHTGTVNTVRRVPVQVRLTGLNGMQQIIIFAPKFVDIPTFIPRLQTTLSSRFLQLRLAAAVP